MPFGSLIATRSPGRTPPAARPPATRCARSQSRVGEPTAGAGEPAVTLAEPGPEVDDGINVWPRPRQVGEKRGDRRRDPAEPAAPGVRHRGAGLVVRAQPARGLDLPGHGARAARG